MFSLIKIMQSARGNQSYISRTKILQHCIHHGNLYLD